MQSVQNLGLAIVPIVAGALLDHNGYLMLEVFFLVCLCCKLIWKLSNMFVCVVSACIRVCMCVCVCVTTIGARVQQ